MASTFLRQKAAAQGIVLPPVAAAAARYAPYCVAHDCVMVSGQLPLRDGKIAHSGRCGDGVTLNDGIAAAQLCALNVLAQLDDAMRTHRLAWLRLVFVRGFVASHPDFHEQHLVMNGASEILMGFFDEPHARAAVGVASLPLNAAVEVEAVASITSSAN